jgi:sortase A
MKLVMNREALKSILRWTQRVLFGGGALLLAYYGYALVDGRMFQHREQRRLEQLLNERASSKGADGAIVTPGSPSVWPIVATDGLIGRIEIPRLELSVIVVEGVDKISLRRAAGHIPGTGFPGQPGNIRIAGHRDTFFRPLRKIQKDDIVTLTTLQGEFRYRVVSTRIVDPHEVSVLASATNEILTLVTCYPFYFVGSAPSRFIVRAERIT